MKMRCLIVDDEPLAHEVILKYIGDLPFLQTVGQCYLATEALTFPRTHQVDLIFLDIRMPSSAGSTSCAPCSGAAGDHHFRL